MNYKIGDSIRETQHLELVNQGCDAAAQSAERYLNHAVQYMQEGEVNKALRNIAMAKLCAEDYQIMSDFDRCQDGWIDKFLALELHHGSYWSKDE